MSLLDDQFHILRDTDWWDADHSSNFGVIRGRLGIPSTPVESLTTRERIARGRGTALDLTWQAEQAKEHAAWKQSPAGVQWLKEQTEDRILAKLAEPLKWEIVVSTKIKS